VANHVSWLDIAAMHAGAPQARFVAKAECGVGRCWAGWWHRGHAVHRTRAQARCAARGAPGGRRTARRRHGGGLPRRHHRRRATLLPFHANLLQAAIATGTPVQPVVLRYSDAVHRFSPAVQYLGATTLVQSAWRVLSAQDLCVHVDLLAPQGARHADRRAMAACVRAQIQQQLRGQAT
jgi:1-acyl-sn-glycerol-3-phosphate acyltransferase